VIVGWVIASDCDLRDISADWGGHVGLPLKQATPVENERQENGGGFGRLGADLGTPAARCPLPTH